MIAIHPAVQFNCKASYLHICYSPEVRRKDKRIANRRHRRHLNAVTRGFVLDPEAFDAEDFAAPTLSNWDID